MKTKFFRNFISLLLFCSFFLMSALINASPGHKMNHDKSHHDKHATHHQSDKTKPEKKLRYRSSKRDVSIPDVFVVSQDGIRSSLQSHLIGSDPLMVNFVFTDCETICPVMGATFASAQKKLAFSGKPFKLLSISIDPEKDTPKKLKAYAEELDAGDNWTFVTGSRQDITSIQRAFDNYRGNKMNHTSITYMRKTPKSQWTRLDGALSTKQLLHEFHQLTIN